MPNDLEEALRRYSGDLQALANDCRDDPGLRAQVDTDPRAVFADRGLPFPETPDVRVVRNTEEVFYLTMPPDPNAALSDALLEGVSGGHHLSEPEPKPGPGSASTASTIPSCLGTFGCATN